MLALGLAAAVAAGSLSVAPASAYTDSSLSYNKIGRVGTATKTVYDGDEFELEVRKGTGVRESEISWSISNKNVVDFEDYDYDDRYDDEIELRAIGKGTAKVTAKNLNTGGRIIYTVKVKEPKQTISRVGAKERTVKAGNEFELRVKKNGGLRDNDLYWTSLNTNIVKIVDDDRSDDDIELRAVKAGKAKIVCKNEVTGGKIYYTVNVEKASMKISRVGAKERKVEVGDDIELSVKKSGLSNSQIKWSIADTSILRFEDGDNVGAEVEIEAKRTGKTQVVAKNLYTGGKIYYTVTVVPDYDDDWDDDWDDDDDDDWDDK